MQTGAQTTATPVITNDPIQVLREENAELRAQLQVLQHQLDWFKRQLFGRKSEKRIIEQPDQLDFGSLFPTADNVSVAEEREQITYSRRKLRKDNCVTDQGMRFDETVPVEVIVLPAPELSGPDADQYEIIDEKITRKLAQRPGSYLVLEYRRPVVKHKPSQTILTVPAPATIFENSLADVSLLAGLLVDKFMYHLPLYRQHQRLRDSGIQLSRSTLTYYVQRSISLLEPIYDAQWKNILRSKILAVDETPIKAGQSKSGKKNAAMKTAWFWPVYGDADEICFTYAASRGSDHLHKQLTGFAGTLLSDGHGAYNAFLKKKPAITQAQCWAHTRRYFEEAQNSDPAVKDALDQIGALYQIEAKIREQALEGQDKLDYRASHSHPKVEAFFGWVWQQRQRMDLTPKHPLSKALVYASKREAPLKVYLSDPDLPIDTNHLERALRVIPMGRKAWLFCWTEAGAEQVGIIQSLLTTCRLHGVDPYTYLVDVLQRVQTHPAKEVEQLTPRVWKETFASNPMRSDLFGLRQ